MYKIISCSQARRRFRRILVMIAQGHTFVLTKNGKAVCLLVYVEAAEITFNAGVYDQR